VTAILSRTGLGLVVCAVAAALASCGGGSDSSPVVGANQTDVQTAGQTDVQTNVQSNVLTKSLLIDQLEVAQTHVIPAEGKTWSGPNFQGKNLHLAAGREALVFLNISTSTAPLINPVLEVFDGTQSLGEVALNSPLTLAPTEANGTPYSTTSYWAKIAKAWVKPGLNVRVRNSSGERSVSKAINVGADTKFTMFTLPFYLFGVNEANAPFAQTAVPDQATQDEYFAKHPISDIQMVNHPAQKVVWPYIVVAPRLGSAAQRVTYKEQQNESFSVMSAVLKVLRGIREANGDSPLNNQYYAPLIMGLQTAGQYGSPGGGLGGSDVGTGDYSYSGIFIHEAGHAFGMPHANDGYVAGNFPYVGGSLKESSWGYDQVRNEFLSTLIPSTASTYKTCASTSFPMGRQFDSNNRCIKQDPMQSGAGDQAAGSKYTMFSDFNASVVQNYFEGTASVVGGKRVYSGGKFTLDSNSTTGYSRWDSIDNRFVSVDTATVSGGLYGLNNGLPIQRNVPVHTILMTASLSSIVELTDSTKLDYADMVSYEPNLTQIYPPLSYRGNLRQMIDPTNAQQLASIQPDKGENYWYCKNAGCDYTLRVTFADNTVSHTVLQVGFRGWFDSKISSDALNPLSELSFRTWAVNIPGDKPMKLIELLETPEVYKGLPAKPKVLVSRVIN
jgi:Peptidase M66